MYPFLVTKNIPNMAQRIIEKWFVLTENQFPPIFGIECHNNIHTVFGYVSYIKWRLLLKLNHYRRKLICMHPTQGSLFFAKEEFNKHSCSELEFRFHDEVVSYWPLDLNYAMEYFQFSLQYCDLRSVNSVILECYSNVSGSSFSNDERDPILQNAALRIYVSNFLLDLQKHWQIGHLLAPMVQNYFDDLE